MVAYRGMCVISSVSRGFRCYSTTGSILGVARWGLAQTNLPLYEMNGCSKVSQLMEQLLVARSCVAL